MNNPNPCSFCQDIIIFAINEKYCQCKCSNYFFKLTDDYSKIVYERLYCEYDDILYSATNYYHFNDGSERKEFKFYRHSLPAKSIHLPYNIDLSSWTQEKFLYKIKTLLLIS